MKACFGIRVCVTFVFVTFVVFFSLRYLRSPTSREEFKRMQNIYAFSLENASEFMNFQSKEMKHNQSNQILFFNRIPKTGSELLVFLLQWLQIRNGFQHVRLKSTVRRYLNETEQIALADEMSTNVGKSPSTLISFDRHVHFVNFSAFGIPMPLYVNILRDPVEKIASRFYYARVRASPEVAAPLRYTPRTLENSSLEDCVTSKGRECSFIVGQEYDLSIPYFCGNYSYCRKLGNKKALQTAILNIEKYYPVVGVLELLNQTLIVLENYIPRFFKGISSLYYEELSSPHYNKNFKKPRIIPDNIRKTLTNKLSLEYHLYNFVHRRLQDQYYTLGSKTP